MAAETWHDLGPVDGACRMCGTDGRLRAGELCPVPSLVERLRREPVARPSRYVTCHGCGWRWSVRATDEPVAAAVVERRTAVPAPRAATDAGRHATRTVLPSPRGRRGLTARLHG